MSYFDKLRDPRWQKKRLEVFQRDDFTCRDCGATEKTLNVHHCFYESSNPWETDIRFLLSLCEDCHERRQEQEADGKRALAFIFAKCGPGELETLVTSAVHCAQEDRYALFRLCAELGFIGMEPEELPSESLGLSDRTGA